MTAESIVLQASTSAMMVAIRGHIRPLLFQLQVFVPEMIEEKSRRPLALASILQTLRISMLELIVDLQSATTVERPGNSLIRRQVTRLMMFGMSLRTAASSTSLGMMGIRGRPMAAQIGQPLRSRSLRDRALSPLLPTKRTSYLCQPARTSLNRITEARLGPISAPRTAEGKGG